MWLHPSMGLGLSGHPPFQKLQIEFSIKQYIEASIDRLECMCVCHNFIRKWKNLLRFEQYIICFQGINIVSLLSLHKALYKVWVGACLDPDRPLLGNCPKRYCWFSNLNISLSHNALAHLHNSGLHLVSDPNKLDHYPIRLRVLIQYHLR